MIRPTELKFKIGNPHMGTRAASVDNVKMWSDFTPSTGKTKPALKGKVSQML